MFNVLLIFMLLCIRGGKVMPAVLFHYLYGIFSMTFAKA